MNAVRHDTWEAGVRACTMYSLNIASSPVAASSPMRVSSWLSVLTTLACDRLYAASASCRARACVSRCSCSVTCIA